MGLTTRTHGAMLMTQGRFEEEAPGVAIEHKELVRMTIKPIGAERVEYPFRLEQMKVGKKRIQAWSEDRRRAA